MTVVSMVRFVRGTAAMACVLAIFAARAQAQNLTSAGIDGVVSDQSGAALPGVTVTASSPALQVQQVSTITDGQGRYRFIDLPRGAYAIRFELTGFEPLRRQGLELTAGFTARINTTLKVGTLNETVTVSGASPVVDLTSTGGGQTVPTDLISFALPGLKQMADIVQMSPGLTATDGFKPGAIGLNSPW